MSGGPLLPSSIYTGGGGGYLSPTYYQPGVNPNTAGFIEGIGLFGPFGADTAAVLQFNMPESIPTGTFKLRLKVPVGILSGILNCRTVFLLELLSFVCWRWPIHPAGL